MKYIDIQNHVIRKYGIDLRAGDKCKNDWSRTHAHVRERRVCKWVQANSASSTFTLLHEIGHIETTKSYMRRCEEEFYATQWAIDRLHEFGISVSPSVQKLYQEYIWMELDRGIRRGGKSLPTKEALTLKW